MEYYYNAYNNAMLTLKCSYGSITDNKIIPIYQTKVLSGLCFSYLCQVTDISLPLITPNKKQGSTNIVINKLDVERLVYTKSVLCSSFSRIQSGPWVRANFFLDEVSTQKFLRADCFTFELDRFTRECCYRRQGNIYAANMVGGAEIAPENSMRGRITSCLGLLSQLVKCD